MRKVHAIVNTRYLIRDNRALTGRVPIDARLIEVSPSGEYEYWEGLGWRTTGEIQIIEALPVPHWTRNLS